MLDHGHVAHKGWATVCLCLAPVCSKFPPVGTAPAYSRSARSHTRRCSACASILTAVLLSRREPSPAPRWKDVLVPDSVYALQSLNSKQLFEESYRVFVFLLVRTVASRAPRDGRQLVDPLEILGEGWRRLTSWTVPRAVAVVLHQLQPEERVILPHLFKVFDTSFVIGQFRVSIFLSRFHII